MANAPQTGKTSKSTTPATKSTPQASTPSKTPAAPAPVKAPETPATPATPAAPAPSKTPVLDLSKLTVQSADLPERTSGGGRKRSDNSVAERWLEESWNARKEGEKRGAGQAVTVPTATVGVLKSRLNMAARDLNLGVAIYTEELPNEQTKVLFAAQTRRAKKSKKTDATMPSGVVIGEGGVPQTSVRQ